MLSCTEFVLVYSELFKFLEEREGKDGVMKYWEHISDTYVKDLLGKCVEKEGLKGCWTYWSKSLNEEACEFKMVLDEDKEEFSILMTGCPSKGRINEYSYMNPYKDYCEHCGILYSRVLKNYGIEMVKFDKSKLCEGKCLLRYKKVNENEKSK